MDFGRIVRQLRRAKGLSQEALAKQAALHPTHISLIETGKRLVLLTTIKQLAIGLGVQPADLMPSIKRG
jgi:transcriptional regulator with XRE-family HTH domain